MAVKFNPGQILATPGALETFDSQTLAECLLRHLNGDWGDVPPEDVRENELSLKNGFRLLSAYELPQGRLWIITESDRSATTLLLPSEY